MKAYTTSNTAFVLIRMVWNAKLNRKLTGLAAGIPFPRLPSRLNNRSRNPAYQGDAKKSPVGRVYPQGRGEEAFPPALPPPLLITEFSRAKGCRERLFSYPAPPLLYGTRKGKREVSAHRALSADPALPPTCLQVWKYRTRQRGGRSPVAHFPERRVL